jgi:hypothetical protein
MADRKGNSFANGHSESGAGAPYSEHSGWLFPPPIDWEFAKTTLY